MGHWTIPKGEPGDEDDLFMAASREFNEETGYVLAAVASRPDARPIPLGTVTQASGKVVHAWAVEGDLDEAGASSNTFEMNWPPGSSRLEVFPEIDRVAWFPLLEARRRANRSQSAFVERLDAALRDAGEPGEAPADAPGAAPRAEAPQADRP